MPHQCIVGRYKDRYYMRVGSNFELVSHGLLAGMFGRQPAPYIFHVWGCSGRVTSPDDPIRVTSLPRSTPCATLRLTIRNEGISLATDLFVNYNFNVPGPECLLHAPQDKEWKGSESINGWFHLMSPEGYRLPPGAMVVQVQFDLYLKPPFEAPLSYELSYGCAGSPLLRIFASFTADQVQASYDTFGRGGNGRHHGFEFAKAFLPVDQPSDRVDSSD
jgi:hypothetical protein